MSQIEKMREWNRLYPVGTTVRIQMGGGDARISTTRCEARLNPDQMAVVWLKNLIGPHLLDHLSVVTDVQPLVVVPVAQVPLRSQPAWTPSPTLRFDVVADPSTPDAWRVESIDRNGTEQFYLAIFRGPWAEARAREYADWKNQETR